MKLHDDCPLPTWTEADIDVITLMVEVEKQLADGQTVAVDTETTGLDIIADRPVFWSLCADAGSRHALPASALPVFAHLFANPDYRWVFTNAKFDIHMLANAGIAFAGRAYDTLIEDWLINPDMRGHRLKACARRHLGLTMPTFNQVFGRRTKKADQTSAVLACVDDARAAAAGRPLAYDSPWATDLFRRAVAYASLDAWATFKLHHHLKALLIEQGSWHFIDDLYVPLTNVLWRMERRGVLIDADLLGRLRQPLVEENERIVNKFCQAAGRDINLKSTPQLCQLFFGTLGRQPITYTDGGVGGNKQPSVDKHVLKTWADGGCELASALSTFRQNNTLISTFIDGIVGNLDRRGRVHTTYNQHIAATGRLTSSGPNLQNIPIRTASGRLIRGAFIARPGCSLVVVDYSQLEQVIMAHMSGDANMLAIVRAGQDIHAGTAALMFDLDYQEIVNAKAADKPTDRQKELIDYRYQAKTIGFGLNYGMGPWTLAQDLGVAVAEAKRLTTAYFLPFPDIADHLDRVHQQAEEHLEVRTILGRPRYMYGMLGGFTTQQETLRQASNSPIQGSAADIIDKAMIAVDANPRLAALGAEMLMQIHDELIIEVPTDNAVEAAAIVRRLMENPGIPMSVPLTAEPKICQTWLEGKS